jgi:phage tail-like protein
MPPTGPRTFLLDGAAGWGAGSADAVATSESGLRLAAIPTGALGLQSHHGRAGGELAGLTLPRGMAFDDEWTLQLLTLPDAAIRRFDAARRQLVPLPAVGGRGPDTRQFREPRAIAIAGGLLYVVDAGDRRVLAFGLRTLALHHVWTRADIGLWKPVDIVAHGDAVYVLDGRSGRVFRHQSGTDRLHQVVERVRADGPWSRLAIDREGRFYLLHRREPRLDQVDKNGNVVKSYDDAGQVRDRFDPPPVLLDDQRRFCLPPSLTSDCARRRPESVPTPEAPLAACLSDNCGLIFGADGEPAAAPAADVVAAPLYEQQGYWVSAALDSGVPHCQWHRVELELGSLPAASRVEVGAFASETPLTADEMAKRAPQLWEATPPYVGEMPRPDLHGAPETGNREFLVQSPPGRYLWLRVAFTGDTRITPELRRMRVHFPRESYLQYLPAVFSEDAESRWFLERFLAIFQTEWDSLERKIHDLPRLADPATVEPEAALAFLAGWLGLPLEGSWSEEQKRRLLKAAPSIYTKRGTIDGLRDYVRVYLENITGLDLCAFPDFPMILEGYRERNHLMLDAPAGAALGEGPPLWSPSITGRAQLGVDARADEGRLIGRGDPNQDLFQHYAHQFRVFVPAAWMACAEAEEMVRRALDDEKPAHTRYDLCLVESRFQVGMQSTLGFDTIIGDYPVVRLGCWSGDDAPAARRLRGRLGYDTILGCSDQTVPPARLAPGIRLGAAMAAR